PAAVPRVGRLRRLVPRVRHARAALLPLDAVDLPAAVQARPGLPQGRGGQLVSERRHGARQRAGHRRALRALRLRGGGPPARAVVLPDHGLRRPAAGGPGHHRVARARQDDAAQLDRPVPGRRGGLPVRGGRGGLSRLHDPPGHALRGDVLRPRARAPRHRAARRRHGAGGGGPGLRQPRAVRGRRGARRRGQAEDGRLPRPARRQSGQRRAAADVRRRLRPHGVRDGRDHGGPRARRARLRLRRGLRPARAPRRRGARRLRRRRRAAVHGRRSARQLASRLRRPAQPRGAGADRHLARRGGQGPRLGQLPPARLAAVPPALLGLSHPGRALRALRDRGGPGGPAPRAAARRRGLRPQGPLAARRGRGLGGHDLPRLRRSRPPRDGHDGHLRGLLVVLPALLRRAERRGGLGSRGAARVDARRSVHRRGRARDPAPALRPVLRQGPGRPGAPGRAGAVRPALHAGDDHQGRGEDVQVPGQRRLPAGHRRPVRRRHRPGVHPVHRAARPGRRLVGPEHQGRLRPPAAAVDARRPGRRRPRRGRDAARRAGGRGPEARPQGALGDRRGHAGHARPLRLQHRHRARHGARQHLLRRRRGAAGPGSAGAALRAGHRGVPRLPVRAARRLGRLPPAHRGARVGAALARGRRGLPRRGQLRAGGAGQRQGARPGAGTVAGHAGRAQGPGPPGAQRGPAPQRARHRQGDRRAGQARQPRRPL
ncbi:MAG: Leucyl-tRNA synthetase, partial [uncultured Solirubrobacteraceae bacterium]